MSDPHLNFAEWSYFGYLKTMQPYFNDSKLKSLRSVWKKRFNEIIKHTDEERSKAAWVTPCELPELGDVLGVIYGVYGCTTREQKKILNVGEFCDLFEKRRLIKRQQISTNVNIQLSTLRVMSNAATHQENELVEWTSARNEEMRKRFWQEDGLVEDDLKHDNGSKKRAFKIHCKVINNTNIMSEDIACIQRSCPPAIEIQDYSETDSSSDIESVNYNRDDPDYVYNSEYSSCSSNVDMFTDDNESKMKIDLLEFKRKYMQMNDSDKWSLSTGKVVEDILYNFDPNDKIYVNERVSLNPDLMKLRNTNLKLLPQMPQDLLTYLYSFRVYNVLDLRKALLKAQIWDSSCSQKTHSDHDWIRNTMSNLLHEYETGSLERNHFELWYLIHVWSFVDRGFGNVKGVEAVRSESSSLASSGRRKRNRVVSTITPVERKIMGRCGDLIIQKVSTEYGCSEAGKLFDGDNGSKLLKDMFHSLLITQQLSFGNNF
ncbi:10997_t:CDS:10 [Paraglomus brasilianum]|uniref:10997_t:CDS:1 n=1 Tax=Paraglomus brasilianum TaxID=144538 RepID=A0A9N9CZ64_9GLOM|nr:10997_t:CDS:10 [Paraglomus brasilianum]